MGVKSYQISCVQAAVEVIDDPAQKDTVIGRNLDRSLKIAEGAIAREDSRIIVFPEGWLQGHDYTRSLGDWRSICIQIPGLETARMGEFARKHNVYLAGAAFEQDLDWPEMWFSTGFIVGPSGGVELRYRKIQEHNVEGAIPNASPADIHAKYIQRYGEDSLFPVLDTPLGRLAVMVENDVNFFELARIFAFHGAEIYLHPTAEDNGPRNIAWDQARRSRCYENLCYFATANAGQLAGASAATFASRGGSSLIDYQGGWVARIDGPGESLVSAEIDLERLRRRRTETRMNYPAQVKSELFAKEFGKQTMMPLDTGPATRDTGEAAIRRLQDEDVIVRP